MKFDFAGFTVTTSPERGLQITRPPREQRIARRLAREVLDRRGGEMTMAEYAYLSAYSPLFSPYLAGGRHYSQHPVLNLWHQTYGYGAEHSTQMELFYVLSKLIPVVGTAIDKRRQLEGAFYATSKDKGLNRALQEFIDYVPVGNIQGGSAKGLNVYLDGICAAADRFGLGIGEPIFDDKGRNLEYLLLADSRQIHMRMIPGTQPLRYDLYQYRDGEYVHLTPTEEPPGLSAGALIDRVSFTYDGSSPWPAPMIFGLESIGEVVVRMFSAINNVWMRVGDPSYLRTIKYDKEAKITGKVTTTGVDGRSVEVDPNLYAMQQGLQQIGQIKNLGMAGDLSLSILGGEVIQEPLFAHPATASVAPYLHEHYPVIAGEIIDRSTVPHFLFYSGQINGEGLGANRAQVQSALALAAARQRQVCKAQVGRRILDTYLLSIGAGAFLDRYETYFDETSVIDQKMEAEADKTAAEAAEKWIQVAMDLFRPETADDGGATWTPAAVQFLRDHGVIDESTRLG